MALLLGGLRASGASLRHAAQPSCPALCRRVSSSRPTAKVIILNGAKYDRGCDWSPLNKVASFLRYNDSTQDEILERCRGADVVVTKELALDADLIARFDDSVKGICEAGTGYNNINLVVAREKRMAVCNVPAYSSESVAGLVMCYILNFSCSMFQQQRRLCEGDRTSFTKGMRGGGGMVSGDLPQFEVMGKTLGLIGGSGRIGLKVAEHGLKFGMRVLISDVKRPEIDGVEWVKKDELLPRSDFVSVHTPLFPETRHIISARTLGLMKKSAYLINTSRGALVKQEDLFKALNSGAIAGAGLDTHEFEPLPPDSPAFTTKNLYLTPHIGWQCQESRQKLVDTTVVNIAGILSGSPINVVN